MDSLIINKTDKELVSILYFFSSDYKKEFIVKADLELTRRKLSKEKLKTLKEVIEKEQRKTFDKNNEKLSFLVSSLCILTPSPFNVFIALNYKRQGIEPPDNN
jgi:hypothetical protein